MSITTYSSNNPKPANAVNHETKTVKEQKTNNAGGSGQAEQHRKAQNVAILKSHEQVSLRSNDNSLSLLYKAALEGINKELEPTMGENAAQKIYDAETDTSPDATAERIVAFATSYYSRYKEMHPDSTEEQILDSYLELVTGGIDKGFTDAKDILKGLKVYEGDIETGVDSTYELVMKGLASFREKMLQASEETKTDPNDGAEKGDIDQPKVSE